MRSRPDTPSEADDTVPGPRASPIWHRTGNGVLFFDTGQQQRDGVAKARTRRLCWALAVVVIAAIALGTTAAIAFDWWSSDVVAAVARSD